MQAKEKLEGILNNLKNTRGIEASAIVTRNGLLLCSNFSHNAETFVAMSATMFGAAEIASAELGKGATKRIIVESKMGKVIITGAGPEILLVVMTRPDATLGIILFEITNVLSSINEIL